MFERLKIFLSTSLLVYNNESACEGSIAHSEMIRQEESKNQLLKRSNQKARQTMNLLVEQQSPLQYDKEYEIVSEFDPMIRTIINNSSADVTS